MQRPKISNKNKKKDLKYEMFYNKHKVFLYIIEPFKKFYKYYFLNL